MVATYRHDHDGSASGTVTGKLGSGTALPQCITQLAPAICTTNASQKASCYKIFDCIVMTRALDISSTTASCGLTILE